MCISVNINGNGKFESTVANFKTMIGSVRVYITTHIDSFQEKNLQTVYPVQYMGTFIQMYLYVVTHTLFCASKMQFYLFKRMCL